MSQDETGNNDGASRESARDGEPQNAGDELPPLRPFRFFKRRFRLSQRKAARENQTTRYSDAPDNPIAGMFDGLDSVWRRGVRIGAEGWIALFTLILMVATIVQSWAMVRGIRQTQEVVEQMRFEQRPWISPKAASIAQPFVEGKRVDLTLPMHNFGNSVGAIEQAKLISYLLPTGMPFADIVADFESRPLQTQFGGGSMFIPPDTSVNMRIPEKLNIMEKESIDAVASGLATLYVFGSFTYRDVWDNEYPVKFCYVWNPKDKPPGLWLDSRYMLMK